jgi:hypothetical protein
MQSNAKYATTLLSTLSETDRYVGLMLLIDETLGAIEPPNTPSLLLR